MAGAGWMDARSVAALRDVANDALSHSASGVTIAPTLLGELLDERDRLRAALVRQEYDVTEALAQALGMEKDPTYGYPIGDHTAETLALSMVDYCAMLRAARA